MYEEKITNEKKLTSSSRKSYGISLVARIRIGEHGSKSSTMVRKVAFKVSPATLHR